MLLVLLPLHQAVQAHLALLRSSALELPRLQKFPNSFLLNERHFNVLPAVLLGRVEVLLRWSSHQCINMESWGVLPLRCTVRAVHLVI